MDFVSHPTVSVTVAANDNGAAGTRIDAAAMTIARLIGRWIAREALERRGRARPGPGPYFKFLSKKAMTFCHESSVASLR